MFIDFMLKTKIFNYILVCSFKLKNSKYNVISELFKSILFSFQKFTFICLRQSIQCFKYSGGFIEFRWHSSQNRSFNFQLPHVKNVVRFGGMMKFSSHFVTKSMSFSLAMVSNQSTNFR